MQPSLSGAVDLKISEKHLMAIHGNCIDKEEKKAEHRNWYLRVPNQKISRCKVKHLQEKQTNNGWSNGASKIEGEKFLLVRWKRAEKDYLITVLEQFLKYTDSIVLTID